MSDKHISHDKYLLGAKYTLRGQNINTISDMLYNDSLIVEVCKHGIIVTDAKNVMCQEKNVVVYVVEYFHNGKYETTVLPKCLVDRYFTKEQHNF